MKKIIILFVAFSLLISCDLFLEEEKDDALKAPVMPHPSELVDTGAVSFPANKTEAVGLYAEVYASLGGITLEYSQSYGARAIEESLREEISLHEVYMNPDGSKALFNLDGFIESYTKIPEEQDIPGPGTYNNLMIINYKGSLKGSVENLITEDELSGIRYNIDGELDLFGFLNTNTDLVITMTDYVSDVDYSVGVAFGTALSIKRNSDGMGAKYILSFAREVAGNNIPLETFPDQLVGDLSSISATMSVYNDDDELIGEYEFTLDDILPVYEVQL